MLHRHSMEVPGYTIRQMLGKGGSASVFLARHHALKRDVALKVLDFELARNPGYCQRFVREAQDTASVSEHPNVMTIYDAGHHRHVYYIALQYLPGPNLREKIETGIPIPDPWRFLYQLTRALAHVHEKGFVHRDIKPANVLFDFSGDPVLADFGVARLGKEDTRSDHIKAVAGTTRYMSPELTNGTSGADVRSDLYSLGLIFQETLTGESPSILPPDSPSMSPDAYKRAKKARLPPSATRFQQITDRLLATRPTQRFQSAKELLEILEEMPDSSNYRSDAINVSIHLPRPEKKEPAQRSRRSLISLSTAILALTAFLGNSSQSEIPYVEHERIPDCPVLSEAQIQELNRLLELGDLHYQVGRLSYPEGSNAIEAYSRALVITPCNRYIADSLKQMTYEALQKYTPQEIETHTVSSDTVRQSVEPLTASNARTTNHDRIAFGNYHALIIGNQRYENFADFQTAIIDSTAIDTTLKRDFGFETTLLHNATQKQILTAFEKLRTTLTPHDNLLIYYAGQGETDKQATRGYWLPVDASVSNAASWIPNNTVKTIVDSMLARHILIVADHCYANSTSPPDKRPILPGERAAQRNAWLSAVAQARVRAVLCANEPSESFSKSDDSGMSQFARAFLNSLENISAPADTYRLLATMEQHLDTFSAAHELHPWVEYAPLYNARHQSGEFIFVPSVRNEN